jgi:hypothetical protein
MTPGCTIIAWVCAVGTVSPWTLHGQVSAHRPRVAVGAGLSSYAGNRDVAGVGAVIRSGVRLESPGSAFSVELELSYHRFTVLPQRCPTCPGCLCSPQAPPAHVWGVALRPHWHLEGSPGGVYLTGGIGGYTPVGPPGQAGRAAFGFDIGVGVRRAQRGLFCEARYLRLTNAVAEAWLIPVTIGLLF